MSIALRLFQLAVLAGCSASLGRAEEDVDPDAQMILMSISMGRGLFFNSPYVVNLNASNFEKNVRGTDLSWFVFFYNSWCGHCIRFAPEFKRLAADIKGWRHVVKLGAVDCANLTNTPLCRDYEVLKYPTLRYFPPRVAEGCYGFASDDRSVESIRKTIVQHLSNRTDLTQLKPFEGSLTELWAATRPQVENVALAIECGDGNIIGKELVLDYGSVDEVAVFPSPCSNSALLKDLAVAAPQQSALYVLRKDAPPKNRLSAFTRAEALADLHQYFEALQIKVPEPFNLSSVPNVTVDLNRAIAMAQLGPQWLEKISAHQHTDQVFQVDIEGALRQTLSVEVPSHKHINGTAFTAVLGYLTALDKFFPIGQNGKNFLQCVRHEVQKHNAGEGMLGSQFSDAVSLCTQRYHPIFLDPDSGWIGCRGSSPMYRGYPCSMWTMFHTLTVEALKKQPDDPQEVLKAMRGYVVSFFGCSECAQHFSNMSSDLFKEVKTHEDSVLWLWRAHNKVNKRLKGDTTEDPKFPKIQFPSPEHCPRCHHPNGIVDEKEVVSFLRSMYTNISYIVLSDLRPSQATEQTQEKVVESKMVRHENIVDTKHFNENNTPVSKFLWDFSLFDVSLFVLLYVVSLGIIVLVCIKFLKNRRYRKKPYYSNDLF